MDTTNKWLILYMNLFIFSTKVYAIIIWNKKDTFIIRGAVIW